MTLFLYIMHAFVELTQDLLTVPGVEYMLSERLCQDPLEAFLASRGLHVAETKTPLYSSFVTILLHCECNNLLH